MGDGDAQHGEQRSNAVVQFAGEAAFLILGVQQFRRKGTDLGVGGLLPLQHTQQLTQEIRTTSYRLHPPLLDELGLVEAIRLYARGLSERSGISIDSQISDDVDRLQPELELAVFRVVQKCLTSVQKHSDSQVAAVRLWRKARNVHVEVEDQGAGIPASKLAAVQQSESGVGLTGMRQRVRHLRGDMNIESGVMGTKASVDIPLPDPDPSCALQQESGLA